MFFFYLDLIRFNMLLIFHFREFLCNFIWEQIKTSFIHSCHGVYLVLDSYQKVFNLLVFLFQIFLSFGCFQMLWLKLLVGMKDTPMYNSEYTFLLFLLQKFSVVSDCICANGLSQQGISRYFTMYVSGTLWLVLVWMHLWMHYCCLICVSAYW